MAVLKICEAAVDVQIGAHAIADAMGDALRRTLSYMRNSSSVTFSS